VRGNVMPRRNYKPGDDTDAVGLRIFECTASDE
jgi:hypothetical protein